MLAGEEEAAAAALERELRAAQLTTPSTADGAALGEVYLIGAGPGDPDLLTLRALQLLQQADVILYDRLVGEAVLERARRDAQRIFVGKESGERGQQERIHALLVELATPRQARGAPEGRGSVRLRPRRRGTRGAAGARHPLHRRAGNHGRARRGGHAAACRSRTAASPRASRSSPGTRTLTTALDWRFFANPQHTVVFYMGVAQLPSIVTRLRAAGAQAAHPVAIIERATLPQQRILRGTLADIAALARAQQVAPPALLIVGAVAAFVAAADALTALAQPSRAAGALA